MVPGIVHLEPQLDETRFAPSDGDPLEEGKIPVVQSRAAERPDRRIHPYAALACGVEAGGVDEGFQRPAAGRNIRVAAQRRPRGPAFRARDFAVQRRRADALNGVLAHVALGDRLPDYLGRAGSQAGDAGDLPIVQDQLEGRVSEGRAVLREFRQVVDVVDHQGLGAVVSQQAVIRLAVSHWIAGVHGLGPYVVDPDGHVFRHAAPRGNLQRVVVGTGAEGRDEAASAQSGLRHRGAAAGVAGVRTEEINRHGVVAVEVAGGKNGAPGGILALRQPGAPERRFVKWRAGQAVARQRADVAHIQQDVEREFVLHAQVVVVDGRDLALRRKARNIQREQGAGSGGKIVQVPVVELRRHQSRRVVDLVEDHVPLDSLVEHAAARADHGLAAGAGRFPGKAEARSEQDTRVTEHPRRNAVYSAHYHAVEGVAGVGYDGADERRQTGLSGKRIQRGTDTVDQYRLVQLHLLLRIVQAGLETGDLLLLVVPGPEDAEAHSKVESQVGPHLPVILRVPLDSVVAIVALSVGVGLLVGLVIPEQRVGKRPAGVAGVGGVAAEIDTAVVDDRSGLALEAGLEEKAELHRVLGSHLGHVVGNVMRDVLVVVRHPADVNGGRVWHIPSLVWNLAHRIRVRVKQRQGDAGVCPQILAVGLDDVGEPVAGVAVVRLVGQ